MEKVNGVLYSTDAVGYGVVDKACDRKVIVALTAFFAFRGMEHGQAIILTGAIEAVGGVIHDIIGSIGNVAAFGGVIEGYSGTSVGETMTVTSETIITIGTTVQLSSTYDISITSCRRTLFNASREGPCGRATPSPTLTPLSPVTTGILFKLKQLK